jgi:hypothetical protein
MASQPPRTENYLADVHRKPDGERLGRAEVPEKAQAVSVENPTKDQGLGQIVRERHPAQRHSTAQQHFSAPQFCNSDECCTVAKSEKDRAHGRSHCASTDARQSAVDLQKDQGCAQTAAAGRLTGEPTYLGLPAESRFRF